MEAYQRFLLVGPQLVRESASVESIHTQTPTMWIAPTREWIKDAQILDEISKTADLPSKKLSLQKIFGSNLILKDCLASGNPFVHYAELRSARENFGKNDVTLIVVPRRRIELRTYPSSGERSTN